MIGAYALISRMLGVLALTGSLGCRVATDQQKPESWLRSETTPASGLARFDTALDGVTVVGLGGAMHGQHESFEFKRALTMDLIRNHQFRLVGCEASSTRASAGAIAGGWRLEPN